MGEAVKGRAGLIFIQGYSRIESFYAQIYCDRILRVTKTQGTENASKRHLEGSVHIAKGFYEGDERDYQIIKQTIDPHDQKIIDLIDFLNIELINNSLSETTNGQIILY